MVALGEERFQRLLARARLVDEDEIRSLSPMLILAPHPDDETLGCGGLVATATALGLSPRVAYLTDGGASHVGSPSWPRQRLSCLRKNEAIAALDDLGVPVSDILFLDWPDAAPFHRDTSEHGETVSTLRRWTADRPPASVWSSWSGEAHCDHVAADGVADALMASLATRPKRFAFIVWGWTEDALDTAPNPRALPCAETVPARTRALARHRSQTTNLIDDAETAFRLPPEVAVIVARSFEIHLELP